MYASDDSPKMHIFIFSCFNKNEAVSLVLRGGGVFKASCRCGVRRLSAVAQGPLTMRGDQGATSTAASDEKRPRRSRIGALAADMFSSVAVTDCRSSLTGKELSVLCVGPSKNCLVRTDGGFVMGSAGNASDANKWWCRSFFHSSAVGASPASSAS